jgi:ribosomal protein S18 acetylase RimI-like enzyme
VTDRSAPDVSWDELIAQMPDVLTEVWPLIPARLDRLWALDLPAETVSVAELAWLLDLPLWQLDGRRFQVSPNQVLRERDRFPAHVERAMASDLSFPIVLTEHRGRWVVLDGYHRLLKTIILGEKTITAVRASPQDLAAAALPMTPVLAAPTDAEAVIRLRDECALWMVDRGIAGWRPGEMPLSYIRGTIQRGEVFVLREDEDLVGSVTIMWADPVTWGEQRDDAGYIHGLMLARSQAGSHTGRQLLEWAEAHIRTSARTIVRLDCISTNTRMRRYYEDAGYTLVGFNDFKGVPPQALIMESPLPVALYEKTLE